MKWSQFFKVNWDESQERTEKQENMSYIFVITKIMLMLFIIHEWRDRYARLKVSKENLEYLLMKTDKEKPYCQYQHGKQVSPGFIALYTNTYFSGNYSSAVDSTFVRKISNT